MKRSSHATTGRPGEPPAGDLAQPDERDLTTDRKGAIDRKTLGPRLVIQQATRDIARGLKDTDLHGTPSNVPGPARPGVAEPVAPGGSKRSYATDQLAHAVPEPPPGPAPGGKPPPKRR
ncbi:MAG TPA: hypothetical protein VF096_07015 [Azonexus sp.]